MDNIKRLKKQIEKQNKAFENATLAQKRVLLAKDILILLDQKKIYPELGTYFGGYFTKLEPQLQDTFLELPTCTVCAIGATFFAAVRRYNNIETNEVLQEHMIGGRRFLPSKKMKEFLSTWFDKTMLTQIEIVFEMWDMMSAPEKILDYKLTLRPLVMALRGGKSTSADRLRWIMKVIIEQEGDFKPWLAKDYVAWCQKNGPSAEEVLRGMKPYKNPPSDQECKDILGERE